jgi:NADH/F420H2 dehydrogenase subunit C
MGERSVGMGLIYCKYNIIMNNKQHSYSTISAYLQATVPSLIQFIEVKQLIPNTIRLSVSMKKLKPLLIFLKNDESLQYSCLTDMWVIDYTKSTNRFQLDYMLLSIKSGQRIWIYVELENNSVADTVSDLYRSADWLEREIWDMFGIIFNGHPKLRRLLTDYGFEGFPLRKDFPLTGYFETRYDDTQKRVVNEPIKVTQEYRVFNFSSPWEENKR